MFPWLPLVVLVAVGVIVAAMPGIDLIPIIRSSCRATTGSAAWSGAELI